MRFFHLFPAPTLSHTHNKKQAKIILVLEAQRNLFPSILFIIYLYIIQLNLCCFFAPPKPTVPHPISFK